MAVVYLRVGRYWVASTFCSVFYYVTLVLFSTVRVGGWPTFIRVCYLTVGSTSTLLVAISYVGDNLLEVFG